MLHLWTRHVSDDAGPMMLAGTRVGSPIAGTRVNSPSAQLVCTLHNRQPNSGGLKPPAIRMHDRPAAEAPLMVVLGLSPRGEHGRDKLKAPSARRPETSASPRPLPPARPLSATDEMIYSRGNWVLENADEAYLAESRRAASQRWVDRSGRGRADYWRAVAELQRRRALKQFQSGARNSEGEPKPRQAALQLPELSAFGQAFSRPQTAHAPPSAPLLLRAEEVSRKAKGTIESSRIYNPKI